MRHEAERLVKQARVDLSRAERLLASGDHDLACFLCHQAVEKMRARAQRCVDLAREVFAWLNTLIP